MKEGHSIDQLVNLCQAFKGRQKELLVTPELTC